MTYIIKMDIPFTPDEAARECNYGPCPLAEIDGPCPFNDISCDMVTPEDWEALHETHSS